MDIYAFTIGFLLASLLLVVGFYLLYSRYLKQLYTTQKSLHAARMEVEEGRTKLTHLSSQLALAEEKLAFIETKNGEMKEAFEHIALDVISQKSQHVTQSQQEQLKLLLEPFAKNIENFQQRVEAFYQEENRERFSLIREIQTLKKLNERIAEDAINLTNALKGDNKLQGNWGEMILEKVLESSGLREGHEYTREKVMTNDQGRVQRPDVILHLPQKRDVIIDAKVSLKAYERYVASEESADKERYLKAHVDSLILHVNTLSQKEYHKLEAVNSIDFVLLFVPIEAAFLAALESDPHLYEKAYRKNIIIVSPTTLLAVLRTIEHAWRNAYQNKNAQKIAQKAGDLYEKFALFVESMQQIDSALQKAQEAYDTAYKRLSSGKGNLMGRAEELRKMEGIAKKGGKELPRS